MTKRNSTALPAHDLAWAAGYPDGEGCFQASYGMRVTVTSTQLPPLVRLTELFGGVIRPKRPAGARCKASYYWNIFGENARDLLKVVEPFMVEKREQAAMLALFPGRKDKVLSERIKSWLRETKTRGYDHSMFNGATLGG